MRTKKTTMIKQTKQPPANYVGRILYGNYASALKERIHAIIAATQAAENCGVPLMPYLAAWHEDENIIWYEYAATSFVDLLDCTTVNISRVFRESIFDQRVYRYGEQSSSEVEEEVLTRRELSGRRIDLRRKVQKKGEVEAIYQVGLPSGNVIWLKDQARIEKHPEDKISLSLGNLTDVTKEMEQKDLLEKIGYFDDLTGLPKRKILERILEVKNGEHRRGYIKDFCFLMIDIDFFKSVNDTHGHQAGDSILKELASVMLESKRKEDEIGRYGGEEFYAICQGDVHRGMDFAERLRTNVSTHNFSYENTHIPLTISIGVASAGEIPDRDMEKLIKKADTRLYLAKQKGRNMIIGGNL